tara:strand:+ start:361 stop:1020 length:660 start_codon:yes stop_codon:yes gene_type:complete
LTDDNTLYKIKQLRITHTQKGDEMLLEKVKVDTKHRIPEVESFTLEDLKSQLSEFEQPKPIYTKNQNEKSYWLANQHQQVRGRLFEYALAKRIAMLTGWKAEVTSCGDRFDVKLTKGRRIIKLEMKSALMSRKNNNGKDSYDYKFQNMKPEMTDFFILIRIDPNHGEIIDVITTVQANKHCSSGGKQGNRSLSCTMVGRYCKGKLKPKTFTEFVFGLME